MTTNSFRISCEKGLIIPADVERARIVAQHCLHPSRVRSGLRMTRTIPVDPSSVLVGSRSKPLFVAYTNSVNNVVAAVFATGAEFVRWPSDLGLPVTSALLDSVMKSLRTGRTVRLWIDWDIPVPIHRADFPRAVARVLFRRRSRHLLSRLRRFRNFSGFCVIWTCRSKSLMLQPTYHPDFLEFQPLAPAPNFDQCWR